jgi:hypothetical protein
MFELILTSRLSRCSTCSHQDHISELCKNLGDQLNERVKTVRAFSSEMRQQMGLDGCVLLRVNRKDGSEEVEIQFPEMCFSTSETSCERIDEIFSSARPRVTSVMKEPAHRGKLFSSSTMQQPQLAKAV